MYVIFNYNKEGCTDISFLKPCINDKAYGVNSPKEVLVWAGCEEHSASTNCLICRSDWKGSMLAGVHSNWLELTEVRGYTVHFVTQDVMGQIYLLQKQEKRIVR